MRYVRYASTESCLRDLFKADYDLRAHLPLGSHVLIADHSERHGFEAILEHEICQAILGEYKTERSATDSKLDSANLRPTHGGQFEIQEETVSCLMLFVLFYIIIIVIIIILSF